MRNNIKFSASFFIIILSLMLGFSTYANEVESEVEVKTESKIEVGTQPVACTMDAKVCPDGSSVGRVGPKCEFAKCPGEVDNSGPKAPRGELRAKFDDIKKERDLNKEEVKLKRDELKVEVEKAKGEVKTFREEHKAEIQSIIDSTKEKREAFKTEMEAKKEEVKAKVEAMKAKFKEDITKIKDENKQISAEKIVDAITSLNTKLTGELSEKVDQIENVLVSIESRISKAETGGLDVTNAKAEAEKAKTAIASARSTISTQSAKVYTVNITTESTLRAEMKKMRDLFNTDMKAVRATVRAAHEAVRTVATTLAKVPKIDEVEVEVETNNATSTNQ